MEHSYLSSTTRDLRQRRQKVTTLDHRSEANGAGDSSDVGYTDDSCKSSLSVPGSKQLWFYWLRLCIGVVLILVCAWVYASYVKQLHETQLWFSNIQVRRMSYCLNMQ